MRFFRILYCAVYRQQVPVGEALNKQKAKKQGNCVVIFRVEFVDM